MYGLASQSPDKKTTSDRLYEKKLKTQILKDKAVSLHINIEKFQKQATLKKQV